MTLVEKIENNDIKNIVFIVEGGMGKVIASTAIARMLRRRFSDKKIVVVSGYEDIYMHNLNVNRIYNFNNPLYLYEDYANPDSCFVRVEPYMTHEYMFQGQHLVKAWAHEIGFTDAEIEADSGLPEIYFTKNEIDSAHEYIKECTGDGKKKFILIQWTGGVAPQEKTMQAYYASQMHMHRRSLPTKVVQQIVNRFVSQNYVVGAVQHNNHPDIKGTENISFPARATIALLKFSDGFIGIDSFMQHACAALGVQGVICWGGTDPCRLGYDVNVNLTREVCSTPFCHRPDSYLFDRGENNAVWNCPNDAACLEYSAKDILDKYSEVNGGKSKDA